MHPFLQSGAVRSRPRHGNKEAASLSLDDEDDVLGPLVERSGEVVQSADANSIDFDDPIPTPELAG